MNRNSLYEKDTGRRKTGAQVVEDEEGNRNRKSKIRTYVEMKKSKVAWFIFVVRPPYSLI